MRLKQILTEKKMTYRELSAATGITEGHLNDVANGNSGCGLVTASKIAAALGVGLDELVGDESEKEDSDNLQNPASAQDQASTGDKETD